MFCDATGVTKAHVFAESWTSLFDEPNDTREHEVVTSTTREATVRRRSSGRFCASSMATASSLFAS